MFVVDAVLHALQLALFMFWEVLWPLGLGFLLSAVVQTVVSKGAVARTLGRADFRGVALACGFGAASSSCSYAAVAVARSLFQRGANFVNSMLGGGAATSVPSGKMSLRSSQASGCRTSGRPRRPTRETVPARPP